MATYTFDKLPTNFEEFQASPYLDLTNQNNTFAMFIVAFQIFIDNADEGIKCINLLKGPVELSAYDISFLKERVRDRKYLAKAYFKGATPENNYEPAKPFTIETIEDNAPQYTGGDNLKRVFIKEEGFDNKRYATFRSKGDKWYLYEYSGICLGVKSPVSEDPWA